MIKHSFFFGKKILLIYKDKTLYFYYIFFFKWTHKDFLERLKVKVKSG